VNLHKSHEIPGLVLAAPASNSGKTIVTMGLLRHLQRLGIVTAPFKAGPDYIDSAFHSAAANYNCMNLDTWAMRENTIDSWVGQICNDAALIIGEGVMGLFDGTISDSGSTADIAAYLNLPVILVINVRGQGASVAALVQGFSNFRKDITIAGVILNRLASSRHEKLLRKALTKINVPVLGAIPENDLLTIPSRHLGLIQASETASLGSFLDKIADLVSETVDIKALIQRARPIKLPSPQANIPIILKPLGKHIAIAEDQAFSFKYNAILDGWKKSGAVLSKFSPLANEAPCDKADSVYLPGGYPELYAKTLSSNQTFIHGLQKAAQNNKWIYGECGGYMVLGKGLIDKEGCQHDMAGLLPLVTSFAQPKRNLGYREVSTLSKTPFAKIGTHFRGHEFHYASIAHYDNTQPLYSCKDGNGEIIGNLGSAIKTVIGSFVHLIDRC